MDLSKLPGVANGQADASNDAATADQPQPLRSIVRPSGSIIRRRTWVSIAIGAICC